MIVVTYNRGLPASFEDGKSMVDALFEAHDATAAVARYETDAEMFSAIDALNRECSARVRAKQMLSTGPTSVSVWGQNVSPDGAGWRALLQRQNVNVAPQPAPMNGVARRPG